MIRRMQLRVPAEVLTYEDTDIGRAELKKFVESKGAPLRFMVDQDGAAVGYLSDVFHIMPGNSIAWRLDHFEWIHCATELNNHYTDVVSA